LLIANNIHIIDQGSIYETAAWGNKELPSYLNQLLKVNTDLLPHSLLDTCLDIERILGRTREVKWAIRTLDIDIIYYESWVIMSPELKVPHPYRADRKFITTMLAALEPSLIDPIYRVSMKEMNENCEDILEVSLIS